MLSFCGSTALLVFRLNRTDLPFDNKAIKFYEKEKAMMMKPVTRGAEMFIGLCSKSEEGVARMMIVRHSSAVDGLLIPHERALFTIVRHRVFASTFALLPITTTFAYRPLTCARSFFAEIDRHNFEWHFSAEHYGPHTCATALKW